MEEFSITLKTYDIAAAFLMADQRAECLDDVCYVDYTIELLNVARTVTQGDGEFVFSFRLTVN